MRIRNSCVLGFSLALGSCRSQTPAAPPSHPLQAARTQAVSTTHPDDGRRPALALRLARAGGGVRAYRLPGLTELPALPGKLPALARVVGVAAEAELVFVMSQGDELLSLDLETGRVDSIAAHVEFAALGPDETLFAVDRDRRVVTVARRSRVVWPQVLAAMPRAVFGAADQRLLAVLPGDHSRPAALRLVSVASDQPPAVRTMSFGGDVEATRWGDLVAVAGDSGVLLEDPMARREPAFVPLTDVARAVAFSPSGHRVYVAHRTAAGLAVIDRYEHAEIDGVALPGAASAVRVDPFGRWLLARPATADSVWVVDLPPKTLVGAVASTWDSDLPVITPDGSLVVAQGADVAAIHLDSLYETGRVAGGAGDLWTFTPWRPRSGYHAPLATAPATEGTPGDTTGPGGPLYVQISTSQNEAWSSEMAQQLSRAGLTARVLPPQNPDDGYRVVLGPYPTRDEAEAIGRKLGRPYWIYQSTQ